MKIEKIKIEDLTPYESNTKIHTEEQVQEIINSIKKFGFNDPIGVWGDKNIIVSGHGRTLAMKKLGYEEIDCIRLDHLNEEERRAYTIAHNSTNMSTGFDFETLEKELADLDMFEWADFGLDFKIEDDEVKVNENKEHSLKENNMKVNVCPNCGCEFVDGKPYEEICKIAKDYIDKLGGFEKFSEWGLIR